MKHIFFIILLLFCSLTANSQVFAKGNVTKYAQLPGVDYVFAFASIDNDSEIHFKSSNPSAWVRWFSFENGVKKEIFNFSKLSSTETYIDPKHNTGYCVSADGKETVFWVMDKSRSDAEFYENMNGEKLPLVVSISDKSGSKVISQQSVNQIVENKNDETEIGCKITTTTEIRDSINENKRPKETTLEGSAPLVIDFFSNPTGDVQSYLWQILKDGNLIATRTEKDHRYTFSETGKYKVRLQVSNSLSNASDSVEVSVSESVMAIPKVFTPNGDGFNDEFRVAYTSIVEFNATILNRWGRVVYKWNNPQTGWDGNIGGKPAPEGTYFYVIQAKGSDGKAYLHKGHINLLR